MPKNKKLEASSDSDSGPDDRNSAPPEKKAKKDGGSSSGGSSSAPNKDGVVCDLGRKRLVKINEFKGRRYIDIREHYEDKGSGEMKPGKKGITLYLEEFNNLVKSADEIRAALGNR